MPLPVQGRLSDPHYSLMVACKVPFGLGQKPPFLPPPIFWIAHQSQVSLLLPCAEQLKPEFWLYAGPGAELLLQVGFSHISSTQAAGSNISSRRYTRFPHACPARVWDGFLSPLGLAFLPVTVLLTLSSTEIHLSPCEEQELLSFSRRQLGHLMMKCSLRAMFSSLSPTSQSAHVYRVQLCARGLSLRVSLELPLPPHGKIFAFEFSLHPFKSALVPASAFSS